MTILFSCLLFVLLAAGLSLAGMKLWVKPKEAMERVAGTGISQHDSTPRHPSLVFHDIVKRLGNLVPASPKDVTVMQRRLIRAGYRNPNALKILYGAKALFGVLVPVVTGVVLLNSSMDSSNKFAAMVAAVAIGFFGPNEYVRMVAKSGRSRSIAGWPMLWTCWWFAWSPGWDSIRRFCRWPRNWSKPTRRLPKSWPL
jgi:hypothetical protein